MGAFCGPPIAMLLLLLRACFLSSNSVCRDNKKVDSLQRPDFAVSTFLAAWPLSKDELRSPLHNGHQKLEMYWAADSQAASHGRS